MNCLHVSLKNRSTSGAAARDASEDVADTVNELDREYVTVGGVKYHAVPEDKREDNPKAFWYA